ncbi:Protein of unknown function, partial [Gryllus bimaculatus]
MAAVAVSAGLSLPAVRLTDLNEETARTFSSPRVRRSPADFAARRRAEAEGLCGFEA